MGRILAVELESHGRLPVVVKTADLQRSTGLKLNRKTLLYGPYGTGKSLAGGLTAKVAYENGWTFVQCKTGSDDLNLVLRMAELYAPAVVFIEDIDILIEEDPKKIQEDRDEALALLAQAIEQPTIAKSTLDILLDLHEEEKLEKATVLMLRAAEKHAENATVLRYVASHPGAVGYVSSGITFPGTKPLAVR